MMRNLSKAVLVLSMGSMIVMFQNCSRIGTNGIGVSEVSNSSLSSADPDVPSASNSDDDGDSVVSEPEQPSVPVVDGSDKTSDKSCSALISGKSVIAYDSIAEAGSAEKNFSIVSGSIDYENIGRISNGAGQSLSVKARSIAEVNSFALSSLSLNALKVGKLSSFAASQVSVVAHEFSEASSFAATLCISAQKMDSLHDLSSKMSFFGRSEGGVKASIKEIHSMAAFISFHDVDIEKISNGAINARFENVHIKDLSQGAGEIYLVDSVIDSIDNYAGTVYLIGSSSVGSVSAQTSVKVVKK